jgi:hypothetical protein
MEKKYYILKIDSYDGDESSLMVNANGSDSMYVVLVVDGKSAEIVDCGYETVGQLLESWNNVTFENIGELV